MAWTRIEIPLVYMFPNSITRVLAGNWNSNPGDSKMNIATATTTGPQSATIFISLSCLSLSKGNYQVLENLSFKRSLCFLLLYIVVVFANLQQQIYCKCSVLLSEEGEGDILNLRVKSRQCVLKGKKGMICGSGG